MNDRHPLYLLVIHLTSHFPSEQKICPVLPVICIIKTAHLEHKSVSSSQTTDGCKDSLESRSSQIVYQCLLVNLCFFSFSVLSSLDRFICVSVSLALLLCICAIKAESLPVPHICSVVQTVVAPWQLFPLVRELIYGFMQKK